MSVDYFASIDFKCPELSNPADYFMSIMSIESIEQEETEDQTESQLSPQEIQEKYAKRIDYFDESYNNSKLKNDHK